MATIAGQEKLTDETVHGVLPVRKASNLLRKVTAPLVSSYQTMNLAARKIPKAIFAEASVRLQYTARAGN